LKYHLRSIQKEVMRKIYLFLSVLTLTATVLAQDPVIDWQNTIGGNSADQFNELVATPDGGYLMGGYSFSDASGDKTEDAIGEEDYWVVKVDALGQVQWDNTIGGSDEDQLFSVANALDGGYVLAGGSRSNSSADKSEDAIGLRDYWIVKLDVNGVIEWDNTIGGDDHDFATSIEPTADGGYIVSGRSESNISGDKTEDSLGTDDYWVLKLDTNGDIVWQNTIGGNSTDYVYAMDITDDGGVVLAGYSQSGSNGDKTEPRIGRSDYWIVKLDDNGVIEWDNTIGGTDDEGVWDIKQTSDGSYIVAGWSDSDASGDKDEDAIGSRDYWILKLDTAGVIIWQNTIGGESLEEWSNIALSDDGGLVIAGYSSSNVSGDKTDNSYNDTRDYWVVKLNSAGLVEWDDTIGGDGQEFLWDMIGTDDGGYVLGGHSSSGISGDKTEDNIGSSDYWIVKLGSTLGLDDRLFTESVSVYPNPTKDVLNISLETGIIEKITIYNVLGSELKNIFNKDSVDKPIDVSDLQSGVYFVQVTSEGKTATKKFVKQ